MKAKATTNLSRPWTPTLVLAITSASPLSLLVAALFNRPQAVSVHINVSAFMLTTGLVVCSVLLSTDNLVRLWGGTLVGGPFVWTAWLGVMSASDLATLLERDAEAHDALRMAYFTMGVMHGTIVVRRMRWKLAVAMVGIGFGGLVNMLTLFWRLGDPSIVRLPLLNVMVPFAAGFVVAHTLGSETAEKTRAQLRSLQDRLRLAERLTSELEQARRHSLLQSALSPVTQQRSHTPDGLSWATPRSVTPDATCADQDSDAPNSTSSLLSDKGLASEVSSVGSCDEVITIFGECGVETESGKVSASSSGRSMTSFDVERSRSTDGDLGRRHYPGECAPTRSPARDGLGRAAADELYQMLPQFSYCDAASFTASRERVKLCVDAVGNLVDSNSKLLSTGCRPIGAAFVPPVGEGERQTGGEYGNFVLVKDGSIYLSLDQSVHHHKLAGHAPVIAAGEMAIVDGRLLVITNGSGHYRPRPECLEIVLSMLRGHGAQIDPSVRQLRYSVTGSAVGPLDASFPLFASWRQAEYARE